MAMAIWIDVTNLTQWKDKTKPLKTQELKPACYNDEHIGMYGRVKQKKGQKKIDWSEYFIDVMKESGQTQCANWQIFEWKLKIPITYEIKYKT